MSSPTETERCIESLIAVFQRYAGRDSNNFTLSKTEFLTFMNTELAAFTKVLVPALTPKLPRAGNKPADWPGRKQTGQQLTPTPHSCLLFIHSKLEVHIAA